MFADDESVAGELAVFVDDEDGDEDDNGVDTVDAVIGFDSLSSPPLDEEIDLISPSNFPLLLYLT